jgi:DNA repair photolyase
MNRIYFEPGRAVGPPTPVAAALSAARSTGRRNTLTQGIRKPGIRGNRYMIVREIQSKNILSSSKIYAYVINPYVGCQHACSYCYARFMKRFSKHKEPWGEFVDVKINAADLLGVEINKKKRGSVWISGVCDPYQPLEVKYNLTRKCLEILAHHDWPVVIQTRSSLVLRDMDIIGRVPNIEVGLSITTADDEIRELFEPFAPPIKERIKALDELHQAGIRTYAMIAPMLPGSEPLAKALEGKVDYILVDRLNYNYAHRVYKKYGLQDSLSDYFFDKTSRKLTDLCMKSGIECRLVF